MLLFNGTYIEKFPNYTMSIIGLCDVESTNKCESPLFYSILTSNIDDFYMYPVVLRKLQNINFVPLIVDELKPLFKIKKTGVHISKIFGDICKKNPKENWTIDNIIIKPIHRLYLIHKIKVRYVNDEIRFTKLNSIFKINWINTYNQNEKKFYNEIQKLTVFLEIIGVDKYNLNNIKSIHNPIRQNGIVYPISLSELSLTNNKHKFKNSAGFEIFLFSSINNKDKILVEMLGLTSQTYPYQIQKLSNSISNIIYKINPNQIYLVNQIIQNIHNRMDIFFKLSESDEC